MTDAGSGRIETTGSDTDRIGTERSRFCALLLAVFVATAVVSHSTGFALDDLLLARLASDASWAEIVTLRHSPFPFHVALWKIAGLLRPSNPFEVVHPFIATFHAANVALVVVVSRPFLGARWAWAAGVLFAVFRPGNEPILWASADSEPLMVSFSLLALWCWQRGKTERRYYRLALLPAALAVLAKPAACLLGIVLIAYTLWIETSEDRRRRLREIAAPALAVVALQGALAVHAILRPGYWDLSSAYEIEQHRPIEVLANFGNALARLWSLIAPTRLLPPFVSGYLMLALSLAGLIALERCARWGLLWAGAFLAPSVTASGLPQGRYLYGGAFGAVVLLCALGRRASEGANAPRTAALAAVALWGALGLVLYARDVRNWIGCGRMNAEMRAALHAHESEWRAASEIVVVNRPRPARPSDVLRYDFDVSLPLPEEGQCPSGNTCLVFRRSVREAGACPRGSEFPFVSWISRGVP